MAIRTNFPADVNPDPDAKSWRGMADAFPFDHQLTPAPRRFPMPNRPSTWLVAAMLVLITMVLSGCSGATAQDLGPAPFDLRQAAKNEFACPGMHAEWQDDATVRCLKEKP